MKTRFPLYLSLAVGLAAVAFVSFIALARPYQFHGSLIEPASPAADFTLTDQNGAPFTLSEQRGRVTLLFFGYTHCPDVCPATLAEYRQMIESLGENSDRARFVFVTVDPQRDSPEVLAAHIALFDPAILGLSGDEALLSPVWDAYGVVRQRREVDTALDYLYDHTARIYLVDTAGNLRLTYPFGFEVDKIVQDIEHLMDKGSTLNGLP